MSDHSTPKQNKSSAEAEQRLKATPILVVDDIEDNRDLLEEILLGEEYQDVVQASSGPEALDILEQRADIGLVLLDLMMPVMDGYETCRRITESPGSAHIPVIVVTGASMQKDDALRKSFDRGAIDFVPKPVNEVELLGRVKSALRLYWGRQDRLTKEQELIESQRRYELAVNGVNDGIWDADLSRETLYLSPKWKEILGYNDEEFPNDRKAAEEAVHPDDRERVRQAVREHWTERTPFCTVEHRMLTKSGDYVWVFSRGRAIWNDAGEVIRMAGSTTDITQRKTLEVQLRQAQQLESIGRLAAGVAHDFNNLLTTILGQANLGKLNVSQGTTIFNAFDRVERAAIQAADFCKQLLAYAGEGCYSVEQLDLNNAVQETAELVEISISKKIELKFALAAESLFVSADTSQLRQVLLNLYLNAAESIGDKIGSITARTCGVSLEDVDLEGAVLAPVELPELGFVQVSVQDTGRGMSPETKARIFDPFFTTKFTGRGLGLSAVLGIIRAHEGALKVDSAEGSGATFTLLLPKVPAPEEQDKAETLRDAIMWRGQGKLLLVDDEEGVREIVGALLCELGFEVMYAEDGEQGVDVYKRHADEIAAVILDFNMPKKSGEEVFAEIRAHRPNARVLLASGYGEQEAIRHFTGKGLAGFLQKPFRFADLEECLRKCLTDPLPSAEQQSVPNS